MRRFFRGRFRRARAASDRDRPRRAPRRTPGEVLADVAAASIRRPVLTVAIVGVLALAGLALALLKLEPSASTDTLVGKSSEASQATERFRDEFGDEAIVVLVKGDLQRTLLLSNEGRQLTNLRKLIGLERCLAGGVPSGGPVACAELARLNPAKVVYGPGTFVDTSVREITKGFEARRAQTAAEGQAAAEAARTEAKRKGVPKKLAEQYVQAALGAANQKFIREAIQVGLRYGLTDFPSIDNVGFVSQLVFDSRKGAGVPKARFAYLLPDKQAALIQLRLRPDLSEADHERAIELVRQAVGDESFKLDRSGPYVVSGVPVVVQGLASAIQNSIFVLLAAALLVMAATLALVFRTRLRLLPLALALVAAAIVFGCFALAGLDLTMASIAALPVLIGLAVDYAIQLQARFDESRASGRSPTFAAIAAAGTGGPTIAGAGLATAGGFLVLLLSPIPMIHGFALLVILGVALAFGCALTAGLATLTRFHERTPVDGVPPVLPRARERLGRAAGWVRGSRPVAWLAEVAVPAVRRAGRAALDFAIDRPRHVLVAGLAIAALGWAADTQIDVESDVRKLVPQDLSALKDVNELQESTGVSGEIDVIVRGEDLTDPAAVKWMADFQNRVLKKSGYQSGQPCKTAPDICPAFSLTDLFGSGGPVDVRGLLENVPAYFSQGVISSDRKTANLAFGIRLMPLERQKEVIDDIKAEINPPQGVRAELAGLPVLAAEANSKLASDWRRALSLVLALVAVFLVLLAIRRAASQALVPLIPIALATGWSSLLLLLLQKPLNPMSATLGALVIAISTEFSVLLSARYREERLAGASPERALERTYRSTGAAVLASGATAIAGFATLIASDIVMLRDFGIVTVVDLTVSLLGVMLVLPAALVWAEERGRFSLRDLDPRVAVPPALARARMTVAEELAWRPALQRRLPARPRPALRRPRLPARLAAARPRLRRRRKSRV